MSVLIPALGLIMFGAVFLLLPFGFPVAFTLMGVALLFSVIGHFLGAFDLPLLTALPQRLIGLMENDLLRGATAEAQIMRGEDVHGALIIRDIYAAMLGPVGLLLALYLLYVIGVAIFRPSACPPPSELRARLPWTRLLVVVIGPLAFMVLLLASIVTGTIYTVEAAALGAIVATVYAWAR